MGKTEMEVNTVIAVTKEMKKYLFAIDSMSEEKAFISFANIAKSCCKEDKALVHLQLFFHLPYPNELEVVLEDPGDFVFITPGYCSDISISPKLYCDVVVDGELLNHFLQMAMHLFDKQFVQDLTDMVIKKFLSNENYHEIFPLVLFMLGKISRQEVGGDFYLKQFIVVLQEFLKHNVMLKYEKLCCLFRLAGVCAMTQEDYNATGSDLLELLQEWNFDLAHGLASETKIYLTEFFEDKNNSEIVKIEVLCAIENAVTMLNVTRQEELEWGNIRKTNRIKWSEFIGVHAFLAKSILVKYSSKYDAANLSALLNVMSLWEQKRPKLTRDDFHGEIGNFDQFYTLLKRFGDKERDRNYLLKNFMDFSYKDIYCTKDGLRIAERYLVPGGDFDTVKAYILNSLDKVKMPEECRLSVPRMVKLMIQKLLCSNPVMKIRKDEIVPEIFKNGAHAELILSDFLYHVNNLCSKIGTIEKEEKDIAQIDHNRDLVYSTCLEDPVQTAMALMRQSIPSQHFKVLMFAKPFLLIPSSQHASKNPPSIRNYCLEKILDTADEHDQILVQTADSISSLISNNLIIAEDLYEILKKKISGLVIQNVPNLKKMSKLFQMLKSLANCLISTESKENTLLLHQILAFALNSKKITYCHIGKAVGKELLHIRTVCSATITTIVTANMVSNPDELLSLEHIDINTLTLSQIGNLYLRVPSLRESIASIVHNKLCDFPQLASELELSNVQGTLITLVHGSGPEEWPIILEFLTEVLEKSPIFVHNVSTIINRSLMLEWTNCISVQAQPMLRQYLKFYGKAIQHLLTKNLMTIENQVNAVDTVTSLVLQMHESYGRHKSYTDKAVMRTSIEQVMLLDFEIVRAIIAFSKDFGNDLKDDVLQSLLFLPIIGKGECEPIRISILEKVQNFEDVKLTPVADCEETKLKMQKVGDVSNLTELLRGTN